MTKNKTMTGHQPAGTEMAVTQPLRLDIQFFADGDNAGEGAGDKGGDGGDDNKNPADPPGGKGEGDGDGDEDELPMDLKQLMADYPEIRSQVKAERAAAAERAVKKRFRNQKDPDNQQGKPGEGEGDGEGNEDLKNLQSKASKLEARVKESAVAAYAAGEGYNAKLVAALAAGRIDQLQLDDDGKVDKEDLEEIMDELAEEFPDVFTKDAKDQDGQGDKTAGTKQRKRFSPGASGQNTNERKKDESNAAAVVREQYERMQKKKLI